MLKPHSLFFSRMVTIISTVLAFVTITIALAGFWGLSRVGFPDGYITEYEKATQFLRTILLWINLTLGLYLLRLALIDLPIRIKIMRILTVITMLILLLALTEIAIPWYFISVSHLDNGHGG